MQYNSENIFSPKSHFSPVGASSKYEWGVQIYQAETSITDRVIAKFDAGCERGLPRQSVRHHVPFFSETSQAVRVGQAGLRLCFWRQPVSCKKGRFLALEERERVYLLLRTVLKLKPNVKTDYLYSCLLGSGSIRWQSNSYMKASWIEHGLCGPHCFSIFWGRTLIIILLGFLHSQADGCVPLQPRGVEPSNRDDVANKCIMSIHGQTVP
jgi:hypothetical protein